MKNYISIKSLVGISAVIAAVSIAAPASAGTVAGFYDQFCQYHFYDTYVGYPTNRYTGNGYDTYGVRVMPVISSITVASGANTVAVADSGRSTKTSTNASDSVSVTSPISSLFGAKKASGKLEITNIVVTSGPLNIYNDKTDVNCDVTVSWNTSIPAVGQVLYGSVSQPNSDSFSYPSVAPEGNSLTKVHSVKIGCLDNITYYFRVTADSGSAPVQHVVSDEQVIFPIKIRTQIPVVGASSSSNPSTGASVFATLGKIIVNPFVLIIVFGVIAYLVISKMFRKGAVSHGAHAELAHPEPSLMIPHN